MASLIAAVLLVANREPGRHRSGARRGTWGALLLLPLAAVPLVGCNANVLQQVGGPLDLLGPQFLAMYAVLFLVVWLLALAIRRIGRLSQQSDGVDPAQLHAYEVACLAGGSQRVIEAALIALKQQGYLKIDAATQKLVPGDTAGAPAHPVEQEIHGLVKQCGEVSYSFTRADDDVKRAVFQVRQQMRDQGLVLQGHRALLLRFLPALLFFGLALFGLAKILVGLERNKPVLILIVMTSITAIFALVSSSCAATSAGEAARC